MSHELRPTIDEVYAKVLAIVGKDFNCPRTENKGNVGQFLETLTAIPHSSNCLDCQDGEVKTFPLKTLKNGKVVPKETIAVTMLNKDELRDNADFTSTRCYKKLSHCLYIPYLRSGDNVQFFKPIIIGKEHVVFETLATDYATIRGQYLENGVLKSSLGKFLQCRTKGAKNTTSRAYYLRPQFMKTYVLSAAD